MKLAQVEISPCTEEDFELVKQGIQEMCLDARSLHHSEFVVAKVDDRVVGFGRIRNYDECDELCSLGVFEKYRNQGVGKRILRRLIQHFFSTRNKPLYVVTVIPQYFQKFGFEKTDGYPAPIKDKLTYCMNHLYVPEEYVVMKFNRQLPNL